MLLTRRHRKTLATLVRLHQVFNQRHELIPPGPTSNHDLFQIISTAFIERLPSMRQSSSQRTMEILPRNMENVPIPGVKPSPPSPTPSPCSHSGLIINDVFPGAQRLRDIVAHFVTTLGDILPYVDETVSWDTDTTTFSSRWRDSKFERALLSMVCAHAALLRSSNEAELYYTYALRLLEGLTLRGATVQLGQYYQRAPSALWKSLVDECGPYFFSVCFNRIPNGLSQVGPITLLL
jgi:hypothetical protein